MQYPHYPMQMAEGPHSTTGHMMPAIPQSMPYMSHMPAFPMGYPPMYGQMPPQQMAQPYGYQPQMPLLSYEDSVRAYIQFKESKGKDPKTIADIDQALRTLSFVRPDIQFLHHITKRLILEYEALISDIPANYRKSKSLRSLRFEELKVAAH